MTQLHRPQPPVCLGCVNKRMAKDKSTLEQEAKRAEREKEKQELMALSKTVNPTRTYQMQKKKEAYTYNAQLVRRREVKKVREEEHQAKLRKMAEEADRTQEQQ